MRTRNRISPALLFFLGASTLSAQAPTVARAYMPPPVQARPFDPGDPDDLETIAARPRQVTLSAPANRAAASAPAAPVVADAGSDRYKAVSAPGPVKMTVREFILLLLRACGRS